MGANVAGASQSSAVSLFSGAGGMDIGVGRAGFKTVCAIESDPHCAATLRRNAPRKVVWQADVRVVDPQRLLDVLGFQPGEVGLLHGGPPCQPFSQIGKRAGMGDPRGALIFEVLRFARVVRPLAVLVEQVPNFLRTRAPTGRHLVEELRDEFRALGYDMHVDVVDAQTHGVAQRRRRALFVCVPAGALFAFQPSTSKVETVGAVLRGLPKPSAPGEVPPVANHIDVTPDRDRQRISYVPEGLWLAKAPGVPADILRNLTRKDTTKYRRLHRQEIAPTLRCGEALYHPLRTATSPRARRPACRASRTGMCSKGPFAAGRAGCGTWTSTAKWRTPCRRHWPAPRPSKCARRCVYSRRTLWTTAPRWSDG